jgi:hypothetical protein
LGATGEKTRVLRITLGALLGIAGTYAALEVWKLLASWEGRHTIVLPHLLNETISFLPVAMLNGYLLWMIHRRNWGMDVAWSVIGTGAIYLAISLLSDPSGTRLLQMWAMPVWFTAGPLVVAALLHSRRSRRLSPHRSFAAGADPR